MKYIYILFILVLFSDCKSPITKLYYEGGELEAIIERFENNLQYAKYYYKNGNLKAVGHFDKDDFYVGEWSEYYADGVLKWKGKFERGKRIDLINGKWPDFKSTNGYLDIEGRPKILKLGESYKVRIILPDIHPDILLFTDKEYNEIQQNTDVNTFETYPYLIKPDSIGELILLLTLPNEKGEYIKHKYSAIFQLFVE